SFLCHRPANGSPVPASHGRNRGPMPSWSAYFEPLARALALRVLGTIKKRPRKTAVPPGIRRAVELLESHFAEDLSLDELASMAKMSRSHFAVMFRQLTGYTPHQYLLLV